MQQHVVLCALCFVLCARLLLVQVLLHARLQAYADTISRQPKSIFSTVKSFLLGSGIVSLASASEEHIGGTCTQTSSWFRS